MAIDDQGTLFVYVDDDVYDDVMGIETVVPDTDVSEIYIDIYGTCMVIDKDNNLRYFLRQKYGKP